MLRRKMKQPNRLVILIPIYFIASLTGCRTIAPNNTSTSQSDFTTEQTPPVIIQEQPSESLTQNDTNVVTQEQPRESLSQNDVNIAAEAYYQELLTQYGENYQECLQPVEVKLKQVPKPGETGDSSTASKQLNVLIALDSSGSMAETVKGSKKSEVAKSAIAQFVDGLPKDTNIGLTVFGHKGSNSAADKAASCAGIETVYPLAQLNKSQFTQAVNSFKPTGYTPIAATLKRLESELAAKDGETNQNVVYVVSDGIETCDGDPVAAAKKLRASNAKVIVNVIGFDVNNEAQKQLKAVADAGGGEYFSARNASELQEIFKKRNQSLAEYNKYWLNSTQNQNRVWLTLTQASNELWLCITQKSNREWLNITQALNRLKFDDPKSEYRAYISQRLSDRQQKITAWREQLQADITNRRDVTIDKLKQDLETVTQEFKQDR
jgi:Ca-activated chloride channel family protein